MGSNPIVGRSSTPSPRRRLAATWGNPDWPGTVDRPEPASELGVDYDTAWARSRPARLARAMLVDNVARPVTRVLARPKLIGLEHLDPVDGPVIFAANHASHFDTGLIVCSLPVRFRHHTVVAAAADHFFDRRWKAAIWSFSLASIPIERTKVNRRSADLAAKLVEDGWSLLIFPEGGRSPDGWGQEFRGGAAYLAKRCGVPVVPIHVHGARPLLPKGGSRISPGPVELRFGDPLLPRSAGETGGRDEDARRFAQRIEDAVAALADESESDWWSARRRSAAGATPALRGPAASPWRRAWELPESARAHRPHDEVPAPRQRTGPGSSSSRRQLPW